jgi:hypothetical protein
MFTVSFTPAERRGDQTGIGMELGTATRSTATVGATTPTTHRPRANSHDSATANDLRRCARCGEQREYCHSHTPFIPNPSLNLPPNPPRVSVSGSIPPNGVARFNLSRAQATALATRLVNSLEQNHQDAAEIPPAYDYGEEFARIVTEGLSIAPDVAAKGLGVCNRRGRRGGQGQERQPARQPTLPTPVGFKHNRGPAFIPFRIHENSRETLARYIRAHLDAPNPFVEGRLSLQGPTYHSEIHAAAIHDVGIALPPITTKLLWLLHTDYMGHDHVDKALGELGDRSLIAEVNCYCRLERRRCSLQESITCIEDQLFTADVERHMCISRLEAARVLVRIQGEMQWNQQAFRLSPWSLERGHLP